MDFQHLFIQCVNDCIQEFNACFITSALQVIGLMFHMPIRLLKTCMHELLRAMHDSIDVIEVSTEFDIFTLVCRH